MEDHSREQFDAMLRDLSNEESEVSIAGSSPTEIKTLLRELFRYSKFYIVDDVKDIRSNYDQLSKKYSIPPRLLSLVALYTWGADKTEILKIKDLQKRYGWMRNDLVGDTAFMKASFCSAQISGAYIRNFRNQNVNPLFSSYEMDVVDESDQIIPAVFLYEDKTDDILQGPMFSFDRALNHTKKEQVEEALQADGDMMFNISFKVLDPNYVAKRKNHKYCEGVYLLSDSIGKKRGQKLQIHSIGQTGGSVGDLERVVPYIRH
jgi:hypothetical protein